MDRAFQIAAAVLGGAAAYFYWTGYADGAWVAGVSAGAAFFLSIRFQAKARLEAEAAERAAAEQDAEVIHVAAETNETNETD